MGSAALIITRNILAEDKIQSLFQRMGFEVLVSDKCRLNQDTILQNPSMMAYFGVIIFSETISDFDIQNYIEETFLGTKKLFRIYDGELNTSPQKKISGVTIWHIHENDRISTLQKYLHQSGYYEEQESTKVTDRMRNIQFGTNNNQGGLVSSSSFSLSGSLTNDSEMQKKLFLSTLSKRQKELLNILLENKGKTVSKTEICKKMWNTVTDSRMTQVSGVIKIIREKMDDNQINCFELTTEWGKGYKLIEVPEEKRKGVSSHSFIGNNSMAM